MAGHILPIHSNGKVLQFILIMMMIITILIIIMILIITILLKILILTIILMITILHTHQVWAAVLSSILAFPVFYW